MDRHKCKLCSRSFSNGRALGGHMKAHLASLPLPLPPKLHSCFSSSDSKQEQSLRENPKKTLRILDPEDRESETESNKNPTRQRSKRNWKSTMPKLSLGHPEAEPLSSVSDTSPEEDLAMCLMMLSRDTWQEHKLANAGPPKTRCSSGSEIKLKNKVRSKHLCHACHKSFRSSRALGSHRTLCSPRQEAQNNSIISNNNIKVFECPFCYKLFGSGQALGGHKRSHLIPSSSSTVNHSVKLKQSFIDLNLPAPAEDDDLSVVSDA
uniref:C2H2-type zinc finger protein 5 n=1 Tax=Glycine max TaxID=3847 RepID=A0A059TAB3_SOYBN|nr:C2H2-type zinc finger protein 5 [Glycine max]